MGKGKDKRKEKIKGAEEEVRKEFFSREDGQTKASARP